MFVHVVSLIAISPKRKKQFIILESVQLVISIHAFVCPENVQSFQNFRLSNTKLFFDVAVKRFPLAVFFIIVEKPEPFMTMLLFDIVTALLKMYVPSLIKITPPDST